MSKMIPAGIVTAYGAAVRGGYQGTYEDFCAALGGLTKVLEDFEGFQVEVTTLEPGEPATADYSDGVLTLGIPAGETGNGIQDAVLNDDYTLTLTWTNGESDTVGPIRGATGQTPDFEIGTVQTLQPNQPATATITGTPENPVLNLGIPKGESGGGDAGDITFDPEEDYDEGTVGAELSSQKNAISQLDASIAPVETTSTASQGYDVGDLLVYQNRLYKVTSQIVAGGTLTIGTNIVATTIEDEIANGGQVTSINPITTRDYIWSQVKQFDDTSGYDSVDGLTVDNNNFAIPYATNTQTLRRATAFSGTSGYRNFTYDTTNLDALAESDFIDVAFFKNYSITVSLEYLTNVRVSGNSTPTHILIAYQKGDGTRRMFGVCLADASTTYKAGKASYDIAPEADDVKIAFYLGRFTKARSGGTYIVNFDITQTT